MTLREMVEKMGATINETMIPRYEIRTQTINPDDTCDYFESDAGDICFNEDVAKLEAELAALKKDARDFVEEILRIEGYGQIKDMGQSLHDKADRILEATKVKP